MYVIHSEADRRVPIEDAAKAVERLHAMRAPSSLPACPAGITRVPPGYCRTAHQGVSLAPRPCGSTREAPFRPPSGMCGIRRQVMCACASPASHAAWCLGRTAGHQPATTPRPVPRAALACPALLVSPPLNA